MNWKKLFLSILLDLVGMTSFAIPGIGEFQDMIWAPLSAYILMKMYPGTIGKVAGTIEFIEELLPGLDFIPTFTITYFYDEFIEKRNKKSFIEGENPHARKNIQD